MAENKTSKPAAVAVGRRKRSSATVKLMSGKGDMIVNGKTTSEYFPGETSAVKLAQPFEICGVSSKYTTVAKAGGGGINGQRDAVVLGISRALAGLKDEYKVILRNAGLLTRDSRKRQRRMVGMGGKSRRKRQSPKR